MNSRELELTSSALLDVDTRQAFVSPILYHTYGVLLLPSVVGRPSLPSDGTARPAASPFFISI